MSNAHPAPVKVRRPPGPHAQLASVTPLAPSDRETVPLVAVDGTLALDLGRVPPAPRTPRLQVVPQDCSDEEYEIRAWAARFAQATVEVLGGDRPLAQLLRWTTARVYQDLDRRVRILSRTAAAPQRLRTIRPQVRSVHVCRPHDLAAEVSVHVQHGRRSRAIAARLEQRDGRWTCVALQFG